MTLKQDQILRVEKMFITVLKAGLWNEPIHPPYPEPLAGEEWIYLISLTAEPVHTVHVLETVVLFYAVQLLADMTF